MFNIIKHDCNTAHGLIWDGLFMCQKFGFAFFFSCMVTSKFVCISFSTFYSTFKAKCYHYLRLIYVP